jgi:hypothetical protein
MSKKISIEFKVNSKNFLPEYSVRALFFIISLFLIKINYTPSDTSSSYIIAFLFIVLNFTISLLTIYGTGRRKESIVSFVKMRLKSSKDYDEFEFYKKTDFSSFYIFSFINSILFSGTIVFIFHTLELISPSSDDFFYPTIIFLVTPMYFFILKKYRYNFISSNINSVYVEGKKISENKLAEFISFLFKKNETDSELYYLNDGFIYDLEEKANVYKLRVETLLIEAVFIGALTFGTFVQLTSPESINSFDSIKAIEKKLGSESDSFLVQQQINYKKNIVEIIYNDSNYVVNPMVSKNLNKLVDVLRNQYVSYNSKRKTEIQNSSGGFFTRWAKERQQTIFSWFYKHYGNDFQPSAASCGISPIFDLKVDKLKAKDLNYATQELEEKRDSLKSKVDREGLKRILDLPNLDRSDSLYKNNLNLIFKLVLLKDQLRLIEYQKNNEINNNPYLLTDNKIFNSLQILHFHDNENFSKFYNVTKLNWDELEYFFFISIGSIICSVLYISVLILRFPIILSIERLFAEIKKALMWNQREESMLVNYYEYKIKNVESKNIEFDFEEDLHNEHPILLKFNEKRKRYTDNLQIQLAQCELLSCKIQTNIQIVTFLRNLGLYTFFVVVLISTMMIDPRFTIFLAVILIYTILGSSFMQEGSSIKRFWRKITHPSSYFKSENNLKDY